MTKVRNYTFLIAALSLLTVGCDKQVSDYVDGVKRVIPTPVSSQNEKMAFKISPGVLHTSTTGAAPGAITGSITPTDKTFLLEQQAASPNPSLRMSMSLTMSRTRVVPH